MTLLFGHDIRDAIRLEVKCSLKEYCKMEINRMIASLAAGLLLLSFEGCSDAPREQGADLKPAVEKPSAVSFGRETKYGLGLCVVCAKRMW